MTKVLAEECEECGDLVEIETTAEQDDGEWRAYDGDRGRCVSCGLEHYVCIDDSDEDNVSAYLRAAIDV